MSNEIKRRVLLASVLKPVDDTRMVEKIGPTLAKAGFDVSIVAGSSGTNPVVTSGITLFPVPEFRRISFSRLLAPWRIFRKINTVKPDILITNTPELLFIGALQKILFRRKLVYDVLENYYRTIRYTDTYPPVIRHVLAAFVRLTEITFSPFVDEFLLAEKGYAGELGFVKKPIILENKLPESIANRFVSSKRRPYTSLLFTGTLAPSTGIFEAIDLAKKLHQLNAHYTLTIMGYAARQDVLEKIKQEITSASFIQLLGGDQLVSHERILHEISTAGTGLIIYPSNPGTESSIPTKLYEYLALKLPVIISHTPETHELIKTSRSGIVLEPGMSAATVNEVLANSSFAFDYDKSIFWEYEASRLTGALKV